MNHSLASKALIFVVVMALLTYYAGFSVGKTEGQDEGHARGKKEGAVRAFAVGYDRGKREREEEDQDDGEEEAPSDGASLLVFCLLVLGTVTALLVVQFLRQ